VREDVAVVLLGNADLGTGNDGPSQGRSQEVAVLEDGIALNGAEYNLLDELLLEVLDDHALGTEGKSLLLDRLPVLLLAYIGTESNDLITLVDAPPEDLK
jgi:hypothetical protein